MMPSEQNRDRLLDEIVHQLKQPVEVDRGLTARVMAEIDRRAPNRRPLAWIGVALAAGMGLLAFFLGAGDRVGASGPGVAFSLDAPDASQVSIVGDFNNWDPAATPLTRVSDDGRWEAVIPLTPGRYQFTFVVDGTRWVRDPLFPQATGDDFGQPTSVITITGTGST
jgi:hypothetical protein